MNWLYEATWDSYCVNDSSKHNGTATSDLTRVVSRYPVTDKSEQNNTA